ncbi:MULTISPECIES: hypothetical protein [unclassified Iodidimonas]|jgi:hypothetical protein|uniref:hypothetical protein n=1 Tax=unclassified Iodidimonas TaxID=2626145 RepID=UPI002482C084|nr:MULTISPECIES: hypothetical protein [unclassified Iodidimonas]
MTMKRHQFLHALACYGADIGRWPIDLRADGRSLLARISEKESAFDPAISESLKAAQSLDHLMDSSASPGPADDAFLQRLYSIPFHHGQSAYSKDRPGPAKPAADSIGAALPAFWRSGWQWLSPMKIAGQTALTVAAIISGLYLGAMGLHNTPSDHVDLSPYLMGNDLAYYEEPGE